MRFDKIWTGLDVQNGEEELFFIYRLEVHMHTSSTITHNALGMSPQPLPLDVLSRIVMWLGHDVQKAPIF